MTPLDRRGFGTLLFSATATVLAPGLARAVTDVPPIPLRTVPVHKPQHLARALDRARPGDHIVLADGTYPGSYALAQAGMAGGMHHVVDAAREHGIGVIVGAQVGETSLLTRAALTVARAAGDQLVAQEGAFGTLLLQHDICDPPLMFGAGGVLNPSAFPYLTGAGLGLPATGARAHR